MGKTTSRMDKVSYLLSASSKQSPALRKWLFPLHFSVTPASGSTPSITCSMRGLLDSYPIPTPNWAWTLLPKSPWNCRLFPRRSVCSKWPYLQSSALLTFLWDRKPSMARHLVNFLVHMTGQQEDRGRSPGATQGFNLSPFPIIGSGTPVARVY